MKLRAYAKINLSLEVLERRPNGYHDIYSLMQGIGLYDEVDVTIAPLATEQCDIILGTTGIKLTMDTGSVPCDRSNLAIRGTEAVLQSLPDGVSAPKSLAINIRKMLPVSAGIAGGSGNAAACMLAVNALTGYPLSLRELMDIGIGVGSDVPFSLIMNAKKNVGELAALPGIEEASSAAYISGIGEIVEPTETVTRSVIMMNPGISVSTKEVYEAIDAHGSREVSKRLFYNVMEEYTLERYEEAGRLKAWMEEHLAADEILMSGSGPTIVAYYIDEAARDRDYEEALRSGIIDGRVRMWKTETGDTV